MQTSLDERIVFSVKKQVPHIDEVLSEAPCFACPELGKVCDVNGCAKVTSWLTGGQM